MKYAIIYNKDYLFGVFDDIKSAKAKKEELISLNLKTIKDIKVYELKEIK